jgi:hypothetical protein
VSTGWFIVVGVVTLLATIRLSGYLTREIAHEGARWCGVCGIEIEEGWVLHEVAAPPRGADQTRRTPVYFCRKHRPADAGARPWHA